MQRVSSCCVSVGPVPGTSRHRGGPRSHCFNCLDRVIAPRSSARGYAYWWCFAHGLTRSLGIHDRAGVLHCLPEYFMHMDFTVAFNRITYNYIFMPFTGRFVFERCGRHFTSNHTPVHVSSHRRASVRRSAAPACMYRGISFRRKGCHHEHCFGNRIAFHPVLLFSILRQLSKSRYA